ncbi:MAG: ABC transporter permease [Lacisediminihabitans sp.]
MTLPVIKIRAASRMRLTARFWAPACVAGAFGLIALFARLIAPYNPGATDVLQLLQPPSPEHWLGTDSSGRDLLSRLISGSQTALLGPLIVVVFATIVGSLLGIVGAWNRGWPDSLIGRVIDLIFSFPSMLLALVLVAVFSPGLVPAAIAVSIVFIAPIARLVRSSALREVNSPYVEALRVGGLSSWAIGFRHLVPNLLPVIIAQATTSFGFAMVELAGISYLGLGVQEPTPDWGVMIEAGQSSIVQGHPQEALFAGALLVVAVVSFLLIGDSLSSEPRRSPE